METYQLGLVLDPGFVRLGSREKALEDLQRERKGGVVPALAAVKACEVLVLLLEVSDGPRRHG